MDKRDFLVEVGTEELPPVALPDLAQSFHDDLINGLKDAELAHSETDYYYSPRRLAVQIRGLDARQADRSQRRLGPAVAAAFDADGTPTRAAAGFAASCGTTVDRLEREPAGKGERLAFTVEIPGQAAETLLPALVDQALRGMPVPRRMRWGAAETEFVRPVHWLVLLLDADILPADLFGIPAGRTTYGHRFHAPAPIEIEHAGVDYPALLERARVRVNDRAGRLTAQVADAARAAAATLGGEAMGVDGALPQEVAALAEWPVPVTGRFDEKYLALPPEVLITTLQHHQRYFPVGGAAPTLMPFFIAFANIDSRDPDTVRHGNERVVAPRLADAAFFFEQDRESRLADRVPALDEVIYQQKLGTQGERRVRMMQLAETLAPRVGADPAHAVRAADLAKCDLLTQMVGEFPELQGTIGRYYALHDGEDPAVADAIGEQYLPRYAGGPLPATPAGRALALADKLDALAGGFAAGARPSGDRDPFALRRAMIGVLRILVEENLPLDLNLLFQDALAGLPDKLRNDALAPDLYEYALDRLRGLLAEQGTRADVFAAVRAVNPARPADFIARVRAVEAFLGLPEAEALAAAYKRIANILRKADTPPGEVDPALLTEPAERALYNSMHERAGAIHAHAENQEYVEAMQAIAVLREPVDTFFDSVMVMAEDPRVRDNRLALLAELYGLCRLVADIGSLQ